MRGDDQIVHGTLVYDDREFANENRVANSRRLNHKELNIPTLHCVVTREPS